VISSTEMVRLAGCTYRQLDCWCRDRIVVPARDSDGTGSHRGFTERQVRIVRLITGLAALGARRDVLLKVAMQADLIPRDEWFGRAYVDSEGQLAHDPTADLCWAVDLAACADTSDLPPHQLVLA
jgi:MerR HTH family regulatory protein